MQIHLHQSHHILADTEQIFKYLDENFLVKKPLPGIHLLPELFLTGYPLQDLCLQRTYIEKFTSLLSKIDASKNELWEEDTLILMSGLEYELEGSGLPNKIKNVIYAWEKGKKLKSIYTKRLLPNYDIFDEEKYFTPGDKPGLLSFAGKSFALLICEDMWHSSTHEMDPVKELFELKQNKLEFDGVLNLSASPFHIGKKEKRISRAKEISQILEAPFFYVNRVGGEDEVLFDGSSFAVNGQKLIGVAKSFCEDFLTVDLEKFSGESSVPKDTKENTWESLFDPSLEKTETLPKLIPLSDEDCFQTFEALKFGFQEYSKKCGFNNFTVALSGGVDSALVLTLIKLFLKEGQRLEAIYMPSIYNREISWELSDRLCENLGVKLTSFPIKFFHSSVKLGYKDAFGSELDGLADENIQSRLRGSLLYARSNHINSMVINTSNKSELAVGYSTLYGDSVGAISLLGDLYKSEVFRLCEFLNKKFGGLIPQGIIDRPPSAELREDQEDQQSLPPYERLDAILEGILSYRLSSEDLIASGFDKHEVDKTYQLYKRSEYKRAQFCPIIKVKPKSFGFGYRVPICKR
ncbi:MAG: NAD(+) synthase [Halobacteriovorax sp.]|nr:NAD(+) synthase [Halobacteriovorax sp.]|tara:strand:+ start:75619 stop:77352 length:1734 start_codon:yes stop_codon:yes gene_type:complete